MTAPNPMRPIARLALSTFAYASLPVWGIIACIEIVTLCLHAYGPFLGVVVGAWGVATVATGFGTALWAGWPHLTVADELPPPWIQRLGRLMGRPTRMWTVPDREPDEP